MALLLSLWATAFVLGSFVVSTVTVALLVVDGAARPQGVPWIFVILAIAASALGAVLARLLPTVRKGYTWVRITVAGCVGWFLSFWTGIQTQSVLEGATGEGAFAFTTQLEHASPWVAAIVVFAFLVLFYPRAATSASMPGGSGA